MITTRRCVFPAEEWEPDYRPRTYGKPGIGLGDFVSDMSYIIASRSEARVARRAARRRSNTEDDDGEGMDDNENGLAPHSAPGAGDEMYDADPSLEEDDGHDEAAIRNVQTAVIIDEERPTSTTLGYQQHDADLI